MTPARILDPVLLGLISLWIVLFLIRGSVEHRFPRRLMWLKRLGYGLIVLLWALSSPWVTNALIQAVEYPENQALVTVPTLSDRPIPMVILSGGVRNADSRFLPMERLSKPTQSRILGAVRLHQQFHFRPIIVSDDGVFRTTAMADFLVAFGVSRDNIWMETKSRDTKTNAANCVAMLHAHGYETAVLVTSALHMRRSIWEFKRNGMQVIPAPVDYLGDSMTDAFGFVPTSESLFKSERAIHEILGFLKP